MRNWITLFKTREHAENPITEHEQEQAGWCNAHLGGQKLR